jgi:hypothetical protein
MVLKTLSVGKLRLAFSIIGNSLPLEDTKSEVTLDQIALNVYDWFSQRHR